MKKEYYKVLLDLSIGSAYEYNSNSEIPTKIEFGRVHSSKFQKGKIEGNFTNIKLHNILFLLKRGCELSEIDEYIN